MSYPLSATPCQLNRVSICMHRHIYMPVKATRHTARVFVPARQVVSVTWGEAMTMLDMIVICKQ